MIRTTVIGAALTLLMSSATAFAQQPPGPVDQLDRPAPSLAQEALGDEQNTEASPGAGMNNPEQAEEMRGPRSMRAGHDGRHWREHHGPRRGWRDDDRFDGPGWRAARRGGGAFFRFRTENGPTIAIECADRDSTLECVNAIMPMLQRMLPEGSQPTAQ